jgi:hypothetical protein
VRPSDEGDLDFEIRVTLMGYPAVFHPSVILIVIPVEVLV